MHLPETYRPIAEEALLTGSLEPTNQWYAIAKIAGLKMCSAYRQQYGCDFIAAQPTNLYGPGDTYDLKGSHVIPALIMKMHAAKLAGVGSVKILGTGNAHRVFMHVDDLAEALVFLAQQYSSADHINVGTTEDVSITEVAHMIADVVGYKGDFTFDTNSPDGTPRRLLDLTRLTELGWQSKINLREGLTDTYRWFVSQQSVVHP